MKLRISKFALMLACAGMVTTSAAMAEDFPFKKQIKARQAFMQLYAYNLGLLGAMAKGEADYDAKVAAAAANNLQAAAQMDNSTMWPEGSDASVAELDGKTRAKPEAWTTFPEVSEKHKKLSEVLTTMAAEAGNGLDAVKANMGAVGKACKGCHESFRVPKDQ